MNRLLIPLSAIIGLASASSDAIASSSLVPSPDSRVIFVSSSTGSDVNSGTSALTAVRSIAAGLSKVRDGYPDWLLLRRGDEWHETFNTVSLSGRSTDEPLVIGSYGQGARPKILTGTSGGISFNGFPAEVNPRRFVVIRDLHFFPDSYTGSEQYKPQGIVLLNRVEDFLIEDCKIEGYQVNISILGSENALPRRIRIRRNIIIDAFAIGTTSTGVFTGGLKDLIFEENFLDHNGWKEGVIGAEPNNQSHGTYFHGVGQGGFVIRKNIIMRSSAHGLNPRGGGKIEANLLLANPVGIPFATSDGDSAISLRQNVVLNTRAGAWVGAGIWGSGKDVLLEENIVAHNTNEVPNLRAYNFDLPANAKFVMRKNIAYNWTAPASEERWSSSVGFNGAPLTTGRAVVENNDFQQSIRGLVMDPRPAPILNFYFFGNRYFSGNTSANEFGWAFSYHDWLMDSGETNSQFRRIVYPDPKRDISTAMGLGFSDPKGLIAFAQANRNRKAESWSTELSAVGIINYIRAGFGLEAIEHNEPDGLDVVAGAVEGSLPMDPHSDGTVAGGCNLKSPDTHFCPTMVLSVLVLILCLSLRSLLRPSPFD